MTKKFGEVVAVNDLTIEVRDQEFLVLVGPSGCGKSTALRLIAGLEELSSGSIYIGGRLVNDLSPRDRDVAMVFQSYALYPHMSVYDNMAFGLKLRKTPKAEIDRRVREVARMLGLEGLLDRKPKQLSGGQRQRVALGRAIVRNPQVFLMDEPLSNLDAKLRVQTRAELIKLHRELRATTVYVTHDQVEAMTMGSRIAVMRDGVLQQLDTPHNLYERPANMFVASFIGSPAMNLFPVRLATDGAESIWAHGPGFRIAIPPSYRQALHPYLGHEVVMGIRPEDVTGPKDSEGNTDGRLVRAQVNVVELLGAEVYVYLQADGREFVARMANSVQPQPGESMDVLFNTNRLHFFDARTELRIA